ncbi:phosphotransferase [Streptomyces sp. NPDC001581]|uniref:phosphotransferase n=1 Tax=Streptomyces sp. NPDC001581 TaxID=3154386 RepID=UPI00331A27A9
MTSPPVGKSALVLDDPGLPDAWRETLNASLDALAARQTRRLATPDTVTITQEQVTQTLAEAFPCLADTGIEQWAPAHADLTWANVMGPEFSIIDWEDWGMAPRGRDAATLWGNALAVRTLADRVCQERLTVRVEGTKVQNQESSADPGAQGPDPAGLSQRTPSRQTHLGDSRSRGFLIADTEPRACLSPRPQVPSSCWASRPSHPHHPTPNTCCTTVQPKRRTVPQPPRSGSGTGPCGILPSLIPVRP